MYFGIFLGMMDFKAWSNVQQLFRTWDEMLTWEVSILSEICHCSCRSVSARRVESRGYRLIPSASIGMGKPVYHIETCICRHFMLCIKRAVVQQKERTSVESKQRSDLLSHGTEQRYRCFFQVFLFRPFLHFKKKNQ